MSVITKETVMARLERLQAGREEMIANLHTQSGAIQDCEHWLKTLGEQHVDPDWNRPDDDGS